MGGVPGAGGAVVAGAGGAPEVAGAGGAPEVAGAGGAVVAGAGGAPEVAGAGGAVVAGAGGADSPGAGGADVAGAGGADVAAGAVRDGATLPLGTTTGATPTADVAGAGVGAGVGIVTICPGACPGAGCAVGAGLASAVRVGLAVAPGKPCRCTDVSVTSGAGGGRSVGSAGPGAVDWPSCGPSNVGSAACRAHAPAVLATTAAASAARRAVRVMRCGSASRMPAPGRATRRDEGPARGADAAVSRGACEILGVRTGSPRCADPGVRVGSPLVRRSQRAMLCPRAPSTRRP
jgi:hypothetical protein